MGLSKLAPDVGSNWPPLWKLAPDVGPAGPTNIYRVFAVAREIIYEHKFKAYTIFLTRLEHSNFNFNICKIFSSPEPKAHR